MQMNRPKCCIIFFNAAFFFLPKWSYIRYKFESIRNIMISCENGNKFNGNLEVMPRCMYATTTTTTAAKLPSRNYALSGALV